ncbi:hypothetical protein TrRE_jg11262 [Triparma retinervis]|uniref:sn-1-specific diacylglycerol lipase n=1 Tax=Triparma retinervis TaxID=2557542 RepID=A0A9W7AEL6_9STRA|nr:hypothetical protein TrRE_jg11262 [Triparma retinervis]
MSAISDTLSLFRTELVPVSEELTLPLLFTARSTISNSPTHGPPSSSPPLSLKKLIPSTDRSRRHDTSRYIRHALGTYGEKGLKFLGILPYASTSSNIEGYMRLTNTLSRGSIVSTDFEGALFQPGYVLSVDEGERAVVLAVRGTIWPHDFLTDLVCKAEELPRGFAGVGGGGEGAAQHAHSGMMKSAVGLAGKLRAMILSLCNNRKYEEYKLVLTGHSLGAGVACLMAAIFLSPETHPDLALPAEVAGRIKCYGYGTPAILTRGVCEKLRGRVTTVVVGMDMVPRFSLRSFRMLRDCVLDELTNEKGGVRSRSELLSRAEDMPVLLPAGTVIWVDEFSEGQDAYVKDNGEFDVMGMDTSFASHMPQNYYSIVKDRWLND